MARGESRMDSKASSILSTTTSLMVEDLIHEYGDPRDFSDSKCETILNIKAMLCSKDIPDQEALYQAFLNGKEGMNL
jgi:hypothetical protein